MNSQLFSSNDPSAKDFYMIEPGHWTHISSASEPSKIYVQDLRRFQHPPPLPPDAKSYDVSIPPDALQQLEKNGVVWIKQKPAFGQQGNRNPQQEAESWVRNFQITALSLEFRKKNPIVQATDA